MHSAEASTPAPTYGTSTHSSRPCTVPSSPNGPCSTGNDDVRVEQPAARARARAARRRASPSARADRSPASARRGRSRPARVSWPPRLEAVEHRPRRLERDVVLARAPAGQHHDSHGVPVAGGVVGVVSCADRDRRPSSPSRRSARPRRLREHGAVLVRLGRSGVVRTLDVEAGVAELGLGLALLEPATSGTSAPCRPRRRSSRSSPRRPAGRRPGLARRRCRPARSRRVSRTIDAEALLAQRVDARRSWSWPDHVRHRRPRSGPC